MAKKRGEEDYLRVMWELFDETTGIKSVDIARKLGVSKASVSEMARKLSEKGLLKIEPYSKILLTSKGKTAAKNLFESHLIIKDFLRKYFKYEESKAVEEAHKLEHAFSEESILLLNEILHGRKKIEAIPGYIG